VLVLRGLQACCGEKAEDFQRSRKVSSIILAKALSIMPAEAAPVADD
jgi:hypothetical protein